MKIFNKQRILYSIFVSIFIVSCTEVGQTSASKKVLKTISETDNKIEDFCKDNKATVEIYKEYLKPNHHWHKDPKAEARQKRNIKRFVDQYDELCGKKSQ